MGGLISEEPMENVDFERHGNIDLTNEELVSSGRDHDIILNEPSDGGVDVPLEERGEDVELTANDEWDDGINMTLGQIFESKRAVQDLIDITSLQSCFEFDVIKSSTTIYVVKCGEAKHGCKWSIRVVKDKSSNNFSVRTYNKMHTCSRTSKSSSKIRRRGSSRIVASILNDEYSGQVNTSTPKSIIDMVQNRLGVKVSYTTAWRGRKQAIVRGSTEESDVQDVRGSTEEI